LVLGSLGAVFVILELADRQRGPRGGSGDPDPAAALDVGGRRRQRLEGGVFTSQVAGQLNGEAVEDPGRRLIWLSGHAKKVRDQRAPRRRRREKVASR
jgi:hypothetical protein